MSGNSTTLNEDEFELAILLNRLIAELPTICIIIGVSCVYLWEFLTTLDFEWSFIKRQKRLTWPMIPYFAGRYIALAAIAIAIYDVAKSIPTSLSDALNFENQPCFKPSGTTAVQALLVLTSNAPNAFASTNLAIRAMTVWSFDRNVIIPLSLLLAGQWIAIIAEVTVCSLDLSAAIEALVYGSFGYTVLLDFIIFVLTASKISRLGSTRTRLMERMLKDGLFYFLLVITVNVALVVVLLRFADVNTFPSAIVASMVSNRLVRRVSNFSASAPAVYLVTEDEFAFQPVTTKNFDLDKVL